jgi:hypothetical protein
MLYYNLDTVVRGLLLKESKSIHYYLQYLKYAADGLQKLSIHSLRNVNSKKLPVTSYGAIPLPIDYVDYVQVGFEVGGRVRPMVYDQSLNRLNHFDDSGKKTPYPSELPDGSAIYDLSAQGLSPYENVSPLGFNGNNNQPFFNRPIDRDDWGFKVITERDEIQLTPGYPYSFVILDYITDGMDTDAATRVDPLAREAIEKYILWQSLVHKRSAGEGEKREAERRFHDEHRLLRASKNNLTKEDIIHAVRSGYSSLYKN